MSYRVFFIGKESEICPSGGKPGERDGNQQVYATFAEAQRALLGDLENKRLEMQAVTDTWCGMTETSLETY